MTPRTGPIRLLAGGAIAAGLAALVLIQAAAVRAATCETYDEFTYLQLGVRVWRHGDFSCLASPMCPPLPIVLEYWLPALHAPHPPGSDAWLRDVARFTREARLLTAATIGVPLVLVVAGWVARRRGVLAGALGGVLMACSPTVLAAASIATTDACFALFAVLALGAIRQHQARPSSRTYWLMGGAIGLALASKQTAAILFPVASLEVWLHRPAPNPLLTPTDRALRSGAWAGLRLLGLVATAFLVAWACSGFGLARFGVIGTTCNVPIVIPMVANLLPGGDAIMEFVWRRGGMPLAIDTFIGQMNHARVGHSAYLMGATSMKGWWSFFPIALAIKSTPVELVLMAIAGGLALRRASWLDPTRRVWLLAGLAMLGSGMASSINIGQRYMILLYPLAVLLGVDALAAWARRPAWQVVAGLALAVGQGVSAWGVAPYYLSYFNLLVGGPLEGHRYLLDSSLDWGQDLPSLRRELDARGYRKVALCYFGTGSPQAHGIRSANWSDSDEAVADCDWLAISATALHGLYGGSAELYNRFKDLPSGRAAYSIFLYDLKDPRVRAAWRAVRGRVLGDPPARDEGSPAAVDRSRRATREDRGVVAGPNPRPSPEPWQTRAAVHTMSPRSNQALGSPPMICVAVSYVIKPGHEDEAVGHLRALMTPTRLEPGCRFYLAHRSPTDPRRFFLYEQYDDQAAIDAHRAAPYFLEHAVHGLFRIAESRTPEFYDPIAMAES